MEATSPEPGYSTGAVAAAAIGTVLFPLIAFIAALILRSGQTDPAKRAQLRTWAWISGVWLVVGVVGAVLLATLP